MIVIRRCVAGCFCYLAVALHVVGAEPIRCKLDGMVETVAFSPDGKTIAAGGMDRIVRILDTADGKRLRELPIYKADDQTPVVASVSFSPDGKTLAIAGLHSKPVTFWDAASGAKLDQSLEVNHFKQFAWGIAFSPDGASLAATGPDGLEVWDFKANKPRFVIPLGEWFQPRKVVFSPDGSIVATDTGAAFKSDTGAKYWKDPKFACYSMGFSPDGKLYVTAGGHYYWFAVWDLQTRNKVFEHSDEQSRRGIMCLAISPDGDTIATGGTPPEVRLWDIKTGKLTGLLKGHTDQVWTLAFSPDGKRLASGGADKSVLIWTLETDVVKPDAN